MPTDTNDAGLSTTSDTVAANTVDGVAAVDVIADPNQVAFQASLDGHVSALTDVRDEAKFIVASGDTVMASQARRNGLMADALLFILLANTHAANRPYAEPNTPFTDKLTADAAKL